MRPPIRILVVEDDAVDVELLQRAFPAEATAVTLTVMTDALAALRYLQRQATQAFPALPHLLLIDLNLPGVDGLTFLHTIRQDPRLQSIVVFIFTTSNLDSDKVAVYQAGAAGYVLKEKAAPFIEWLKLYCALVEFPAT